jgi:hypothetical protein
MTVTGRVRAIPGHTYHTTPTRVPLILTTLQKPKQAFDRINLGVGGVHLCWIIELKLQTEN